MSEGEVTPRRHPAEFRQYQFRLPKGATDVLLVRHGESAPLRDDGQTPVIDGHSDPELAARGLDQAERLAERFAGEHVDAIYVSTLRRTVQTATPLARVLGLEPIVEPDLREVHLGDWEGYPLQKYLRERHPLAMKMVTEHRWDALPGAESNEAFEARVGSALERIIASHTGQRVVVVAHGGVIGQAIGIATGAPAFHFGAADNASVSEIVALPDPLLIRLFNDTSHL